MLFVQWTMPGFADLLVFTPRYVLTQPWTLVTYMFLHGGLMHIFFNMMMLWFAGPMVEERMGPQRFLTLYLVSGVAGALLSLVLAPRTPIIGASAAVMGVL